MLLLVVSSPLGGCYALPVGAASAAGDASVSCGEDATIAPGADATPLSDAPGVDAARDAADAGRSLDAADAAVDSRGGDVQSAREADPPLDASDGASPADATDASDAADARVFSLDAGSTWTDLFRDYFGPAGVASCAGDGECHGSKTQMGYDTSHFLCPPGNRVGCWKGMTSWGDGGANLIEPDASFDADYLHQILCKADGTGGAMPYMCSYSFTAVDMARIGAWVGSGAPDN
jgi:hypothetical protein